MSFNYLTNEKNDTFFTYNNISTNSVSILFYYFLKSTVSNNKDINELINFLEKYMNKKNYETHNLNYINLKNIKKNNEQNDNLLSNISYLNLEINNELIHYNFKIFVNRYSYYDLFFKDNLSKIYLINNIKELKENTIKIIKDKINIKNIEKKNIDCQNMLKIIENKENVSNLIKDISNKQFIFKIPNNKNNNQEIQAKFQPTFIEDIVKNNISSLQKDIKNIIDANEKIINFFKEQKEQKIVSYKGNIFNIEKHDNEQEIFYVIASDNKKSGFLGFKIVHPRGYGECFVPIVVQNIENATLFNNDNNLPKSSYNIKLLDKVYIKGNFSKIVSLGNEISELGNHYKAIIEKSLINKSIISESNMIKSNTTKKNKI